MIPLILIHDVNTEEFTILLLRDGMRVKSDYPKCLSKIFL